MKFNIQKLIIYGDNFADYTFKNMKNKFWANVAECARDFIKNIKVKNTHELHNSPLWHNSSINLQFRNEWANKGVNLVKDILNDEGALYTLNELN